MVMGGLAAQSLAQNAASFRPSATSQSGQFVVSRHRGATHPTIVSALTTQAQCLELEPTLLVVSCERIRQALDRELGLTAPWQGRIHVLLRPAQGAEDAITLTAEKFRDGWAYRLSLPEVVAPHRLMRAVVEAILLEVANRHHAGRSAEIPPWLAVGLAERLLALAGPELLFPPPRLRVGALTLSPSTVTSRPPDPLAQARAQLREHAPLTLQDLSWPTEADFTGDTAAGYRASAHLFVVELLRLRDGPASLRALLEELPRHYNWQTSFLKAFPLHFQQLRDVEKWWAVQVVYLSGRDLAHTWSVAESWRKLDAVRRVPALVRPTADTLPEAAAEIPLATVIRDWDFVRQTAALRAQIQQLELLRQRVAPELLPLADAYRRVLAEYLDQRNKTGMVLAQRGVARPGHGQLIRDTLRRLAELDRQLAQYQPEEPTPTAEAKPAASTPQR